MRITELIIAILLISAVIIIIIGSWSTGKIYIIRQNYCEDQGFEYWKMINETNHFGGDLITCCNSIEYIDKCEGIILTRDLLKSP